MSTNSVRNRAGFDERQLSARGKVAFVSFLSVLVLVMLNGWVTDRFGAWGTGLQQAMTIFFIAMSVFTSQVIWRGAYYKNDRAQRWSLAAFGVLLVLFLTVLGMQAARGELVIWSGSRAGEEFVPVVVTAWMLSAVLATIARMVADRRAE